MKQVQKGFTLIELMIVVAIIGILAAIAIPQYQDYISRSQVSRVVGEASSVRTAIEEILMRGGTPTTTAADEGPVNFFVGFDADRSNLMSVFDVEADDEGVVTVTATMGVNANNAVSGADIIWVRDAAGVWTCSVDSDGPAWKDSFAPAGCPSE